MSRLAAWLVVAALAVLALVAVANGRGSGTVALCAKGDAGALRLAKNGKCGAGERKVSIAKQGPRGAAGNPGPTGPPGPAGADASAAVLAPEPVQFVQTWPEEVGGSCSEKPGFFCAYSALKFDNVGGGFAKVGYFKDSSGFVHLQGMTKYVCHNNCNGASYGSTIFYLPPGYRPDAIREYAIDRCETGQLRYIDITPDGAVTLSTEACGSESLDGISFHP
jgi:hypothetical protein